MPDTQYRVLQPRRGPERDVFSRNEPGPRLVRQVPDVTRLLDRLEEAKLIARTRGGEDRRFVLTRITRAGLKLLAQVEQRIDDIHDEQLGHLDESQLRKLISLLEVVRARP